MKYRDLLVIFVTASLLLIGFQFQGFTTIHSTKMNNNNVLGILDKIAQKEHVSAKYLQTNTTTANDQMLVRNSRKHHFYRILYNDDQTGFLTEKINVQLTKTKVKVVGGY